MKRTLLLTTSAIIGLTSIANAQTPVEAKINRIEKRMIAIEKQVYSGKSSTSVGVSADNKLLANTQAELANMQEQNAKLYGKIEELSYAVEKLAEQVKLVSEDFDYRLNEIESNKDASAPVQKTEKTADKGIEIGTATASTSKAVTPAKGNKHVARTKASVPNKLSPEKLYEKAYNYLTLAEYNKSADWFETFIDRFPQHKYADNSFYWLGEISLVQGKSKDAVSKFAKGLKTFPNGAKAPANLLKIGVAFKQMGNNTHAKNSWNKLIKDYPNTPEAKKAKLYLKDL
ncbi:MAG TPA: tol-pal system protein YbgF [Alphaproteobacteria bacterium]|nr:tol-pal system protein YbgF [Alphaproteobacteria bacterium]